MQLSRAARLQKYRQIYILCQQTSLNNCSQWADHRHIMKKLIQLNLITLRELNMKIQRLFFIMALPALLTLAGCEATQPTIETKAEPVAVAAPAVKSEAVAPVAAANPEHCAKHGVDKEHNCIAHCAKHKGKKSKTCRKHCETTVAPHHDCAKHCADNPGVKDQACAQHCTQNLAAEAHECGSEHCAHHGSAATKNCDASHCSHHKGVAAHQCGAEHCEKHGGDMSKCCGSEQKCDK